MFAGDKRYFCADISSDVVIGATMHGKLWPVPLLTQEKVDQAMREDREAALREYKNIFTKLINEFNPLFSAIIHY